MGARTRRRIVPQDVSRPTTELAAQLVRVLLVTHRFPPDGVGGVEQYVLRLRAALEERGDVVDVLTRSPRHFPRKPRLRSDEGVHRIVGSGVRLREFLRGHVAVEAAFQRVLRETEPDVVHVNHLIGLSPRVVSIARGAGVPVVLSTHDYYVACPLVHLVKVDGTLCAGPDGGRECATTCFADEGVRSARWTLRYDYFRELLGLANRVVCPSARVADLLEGMAPDAEVETLALGVSASAHAEAPRDGPPVFAHVGSASRHKGVFAVVEALREADLGEARLLVLGGFDRRLDERELRRAAAATRGLELDVRGRYDARELPVLLGGVSAVVAASQVPEAFPLAPREALAAGVPVVTVRIGGLADVVDDGVNGLVVEPRNAGALGHALRRVAREPGLLAQLREGARRTAVPTFDSHVDALRSLYERVRSAPAPASVDAFERVHRELLEAGFARRR